MKKLLEAAQDLNIYKVILDRFAEFVDSQPGTGMDKVYRQLLDCGLKCVPKDKRALEILTNLALGMSTPAVIQNLLNTSFSDLPITLRPVYNAAPRKPVAFWSKGGKLYSKVFDLIDIEGEGSKGLWTDEQGNKVELINLIEA